jgi:cytoskeletal protein RodZ
MGTKSSDPGSPKVTETATEARQGSYGKPVFVVLACGIFLALFVWVGVEMWGESIDQDAKPTASTTPDPINAQPSGAGTFDNNPADGGSRPPEAIDRSPSPSGNGGGPTQVTTPAGTEKTK